MGSAETLRPIICHRSPKPSRNSSLPVARSFSPPTAIDLLRALLTAGNDAHIYAGLESDFSLWGEPFSACLPYVRTSLQEDKNDH